MTPDARKREYRNVRISNRVETRVEVTRFPTRRRRASPPARGRGRGPPACSPRWPPRARPARGTRPGRRPRSRPRRTPARWRRRRAAPRAPPPPPSAAARTKRLRRRLRLRRTAFDVDRAPFARARTSPGRFAFRGQQRLDQRASHLLLVQRPAPVLVPVREPRVGVSRERGRVAARCRAERNPDPDVLPGRFRTGRKVGVVFFFYFRSFAAPRRAFVRLRSLFPRPGTRERARDVLQQATGRDHLAQLDEPVAVGVPRGEQPARFRARRGGRVRRVPTGLTQFPRL